MKIIKLNEAMNNMPDIEDKLQGVVDPVMAKAKIDSKEAEKETEKIVEPAEKFDRKADCAFGAEKQPKPEKAEKELEKINLDESLFESTISEEVAKAKTIKDIKTGDTVTITGKNDVEVNNNAKKFAQNHGGTSRYDLTDDPEMTHDKTLTAEVGESLEEDFDDIETFIDSDMQNGNAFCIMGYTANAMKECGLGDEIKEMRTRAMSSDYNNLCAVCQEYIDRCNEIHDEFDDSYEVEGLEFVTDGISINEGLTKNQLEDMYLGKKIKIGAMINPDSTIDDSRYNGKEGTVELIDDMGQLHGTWGGLAVIPGVDDFKIIG